jgi:hypothetical protein
MAFGLPSEYVIPGVPFEYPPRPLPPEDPYPDFNPTQQYRFSERTKNRDWLPEVRAALFDQLKKTIPFNFSRYVKWREDFIPRHEEYLVGWIYYPPPLAELERFKVRDWKQTATQVLVEQKSFLEQIMNTPALMGFVNPAEILKQYQKIKEVKD